MTEHRDDIVVHTGDLKTGEKVIVDRDAEGRIQQVRKVEARDCWIVTAYYGEPRHPNVEAIRHLRQTLIATAVCGSVVNRVNTAYLRLGRTRIGRWWRSELAIGQNRIVKYSSQLLCMMLMWIAARSADISGSANARQPR